jgi:hypothetical protein
MTGSFAAFNPSPKLALCVGWTLKLLNISARADGRQLLFWLVPATTFNGGNHE